jgi:hypothetical protein
VKPARRRPGFKQHTARHAGHADAINRRRDPTPVEAGEEVGARAAGEGDQRAALLLGLKKIFKR